MVLSIIAITAGVTALVLAACGMGPGARLPQLQERSGIPMSHYTKEEILSKVDHTLLKPEATWPQVQKLCDEAIRYRTASVCINTCYVRQAVEYMAGRVPVCCVVGFPLGAMDTQKQGL